DRIARQPAGPIRSPALAADHQIGHRHRDARHRSRDLIPHLGDDPLPLLDAASRPALLLNPKPLPRPTGFPDDLRDLVRPGVYAPAFSGFHAMMVFPPDSGSNR